MGEKKRSGCRFMIFNTKNYFIYSSLFEFQGLHVRAVTVSEGSSVKNLKEIPGQNGLYKAEGIYPEIFEELRSLLNFTYSLKLPPDGAFGSELPNGSWTGIVNCLMEDECDVGVAEMAKTLNRLEVISFSRKIRYFTFEFFVKSNKEYFNLQAYIAPLRDLLWLIIILFCVMTPISLFLSYK